MPRYPHSGRSVALMLAPQHSYCPSPAFEMHFEKPNQVRMGEGREDRTQIEDHFTVPKTVNNVSEIHVKRTRSRRDSLHSWIRGPIPGSSVSNTGPVRASS